MDKKDWELVKAIHQEGSAIKAAEKLFLSQPAVSYRIKKIEEEMGVPLFIKSNRGIVFTSAGERLLSFANEMLSQYDEVLEKVRKQDGVVRGTIHMGAPPHFATMYLPSLFREFSNLHPETTLRLYSGVSSDLMNQLERREILMCVVRGHHPWNEGKLNIFEETIQIVSSKPIELEELEYMPYIGYRTDPQLQGQIDGWWRENFSAPPNIVIHTYNSSSCIPFIREGLGFTLLPSISIPPEEHFYTQTIANIKGEAYVRPTRLLYYNRVENFDVYNVFIEFFKRSLFVTANIASSSP
ncbi:LysR family transcriptional regulator [Synergistaceae bacterium OttesenSCG-928-I11]|nr:LysR family transcriptional regulator [Synergistaceae bacterium OttesenSCG-928-I11]